MNRCCRSFSMTGGDVANAAGELPNLDESLA